MTYQAATGQTIIKATQTIDLVFWRSYIERKIGFVLPVAQERWLVNSVLAVMKELDMDEQTLVKNLDNLLVRQKLIDAILIPETRFFRDKQVVDFVVDAFDKHLHAHLDNPTPFVVASIGCSTGQELWSLAVALEYKRIAYSKLHNRVISDFELVGVDASMRSLKIARIATYDERAFAQIPKPYRRFWRMTHKYWQIVPALQKKAQFIKCNVFDGNEFQERLSHHTQKLSLVLCQNMLIYFRRFDQRDILGRFVDLLMDNGHLILSAVDGTFWKHDKMQRLHHEGANIWGKTNQPTT